MHSWCVRTKILYSAFFLVITSCGTGYNQTAADEAYAQRYSTGRQMTPNYRSTGSGAGALLATALAVPMLCGEIDRAGTSKARAAKCDELFRHLSNTDAAAHEWQNYYGRCKRM